MTTKSKSKIAVGDVGPGSGLVGPPSKPIVVG
ncbi:hypothetical protein LCGC14_2280390, partial [marine sediment metagenome]